MIKNYFLTALRSLSKNKIFSLINVSGLVIGITAFLLIILYADHEFSYDDFHEKKDDLYRVQLNRYNKGELTTQWAAGCAGIGPDLKANFPEVLEFVKMIKSNAVVSYGEKVFKEDHAYYATNSFFDLFTVPLITKKDTGLLTRPYTMVISESAAKRYFGDEDPVGKTLRHNGARDFEITGVYKDIPANSHMKADMLFSFETYVDLTSEGARTNWQWDGFYTYILLEQGTDKDEFESKLPQFVIQQVGEDLIRWDAGMEFNLQPIMDIHLYSDYMMEFQPNGDGEATYFLLIIAGFLILISWINYVNLATAKSLERAREVGIRKVMGSYRSQLVRQFLVESVILNLLAIIISIILIYSVISSFNQLAGRQLQIDPVDPVFWGSLVTLWLAGGLFSGIYPAFVLSSFKPVSVLKGQLSRAGRGTTMRKGLVIFQFFASLVLMIGTYTIISQLNYMKSRELGVHIDQTLVVRGPNVTDSLYTNKFNTFKQTLLGNSEIQQVTASTAVPGRRPGWNAGGIRLLEQEDSESNQYRIIGVDHDFMNAYNLEVISGRGFEDERSNEQTKVLFNESGISLLGFSDYEEALNREIMFWGDTFKIVGIVKNYHQESLKKSFEPLIFRYIPNTTNFYSVKVSTSDLRNTISMIGEKWKSFFPGNPFDYFFLDEYFDQQYRSEEQFGKVFSMFASLTIFIACLGLFGLASYMTIQRTKEIGVRKVLGASVFNILALLSNNFTKLILISIVLAIPVAWYLMNDWLNDFAYRIGLSWWIFVVPCVILLLIAWLTISFQTVKAAVHNPAQSLRYE